MKKFYLLIFLSVLFLSFKVDSNKIVGTWTVEKLIVNGKVKEVTKKWLRFNKDGKLEGGDVGSEASKIGEWILDKEKKTLEIKSESGNKDDGVDQIVEFNKKEMILERDKVRVVLVKK